MPHSEGKASFKGSPTGKHVTTMVPNCPSAVGASRKMPNCVPPPYPRCTAASCYNLDPHAEGCGTATTYNHISIQYNSFVLYPGTSSSTVVAYIYNYYSPWCKTNWAEAAVLNPYIYSVGLRIQITTTDVNRYKEEMCYPDDCWSTDEYAGPWPDWTNMVDGTNKTDACGDSNITTQLVPVCADQ